jgi:hypothetical protein
VLIAAGTDNSHAVGIIGIRTYAEGERRAVIKDKASDDQPSAAIRAAPLLSEDDLGFESPEQWAASGVWDLSRP